MAEETSLKLLDILDKLSKKVEEDVAGEKAEKFVFDEDIDIELDEDLRNEIADIENRIKEAGYIVEVTEDIDIEDVSSKSKFKIIISNLDKCFVEIDLFKYRDIMMTYGESEESFIQNQLNKISGIDARNLDEISKDICKYLSYVCHFSELQIKLYSNIGWCTYKNENIFKYDIIYGQSGSDGNGLLSRCDNPIGDELHVKRNSEIDNIRETYEWIKSFIQVLEYDASISYNERERKPYNSLIIAAACTGLIRPLLPFTKENNINMNIVGQRASGKSTICHFALSLFGNPEQLEGSFIDSDEAAEIIRAKRPVIPYILDERMLKIENESDKVKYQKTLMSVFREYEGKIKERMAGTARELSGQRTFAPVISSSVEPMMDLLLQGEKDLGQYRRFIEINIEPEDLFADSEMAQSIEQLAYDKYGYGVELIVKYILDSGMLDTKDEKSDKNNISKLYDSILKVVNDELEQREQAEKANGNYSVLGLKSSAMRFSLIILTLRIIEEAILDFLKTNMLLINEEQTINSILNGDYLKNEKEVLDILVDNLVDKMKRVNIKLNVYDNIIKFIREYSDLFAGQQADYNKDTEGKYIGYIDKKAAAYKASNEDELTLVFDYNKGFEWIVAGNGYQGLPTEKDEIIEYVKNARANEEYVQSRISGLRNESLESKMTQEDKGRVRTHKIVTNSGTQFVLYVKQESISENSPKNKEGAGKA